MKEMRFNRQEFAGSLGDLGTLLPLSIGLIQINGLDVTAVLLSIGLFYVLSGLYFGVIMPVQPMKVIGAYAIARMLTPLQITTAGMWMGILLLILALTGAMTVIGRIFPRPAVRGIQLTIGLLLLSKGVRFILGSAEIQELKNAAEPFLVVQSIGPVPISVILGVLSLAAILYFIRNERFPAALIVIFSGAAVGLAFGAYAGFPELHVGFHLPDFLPFGIPAADDVILALTVLALPQLPMTVGNAVIAQADLTNQYFGPEKSKKTTVRALTISMGIANIVCAMIGAMPLCHGAGGLAAHYRFGARTHGANLIIGVIFVFLALIIGDQADRFFSFLPLSVLGALLVFAGAQLALTIMDVRGEKDFFVIFIIFGVSLASNLAIGFIAGILFAYALKHPRLNI